jgi:hypothetical protein
MKTCPLCKQSFEGQAYKIGYDEDCCKQCYDKKRIQTLSQTDSEVKKVMRTNNALSMLGNIAAIALIVGIVLSIKFNLWIGIATIAVSFATLIISVHCSIRLEHKLNQIIKNKFPDIILDEPWVELGLFKA